jgi:hypothetical protein
MYALHGLRSTCAISFADDPIIRCGRPVSSPNSVSSRTRGAGGRSGLEFIWPPVDRVARNALGDELSTKTTVVPVPSTAPWFVVRTGLADEFLPELPGLRFPRTGPGSTHTFARPHVAVLTLKRRQTAPLFPAALFHDVGKAATCCSSAVDGARRSTSNTRWEPG